MAAWDDDALRRIGAATEYDRYGAGPVGAITGPDAATTTLLVMPA